MKEIDHNKVFCNNYPVQGVCNSTDRCTICKDAFEAGIKAALRKRLKVAKRATNKQMAAALWK